MLGILLEDKSTKKNIIWATDTYTELGENFTDKDQIKLDPLLDHADVILPRIQKPLHEQAIRTRKKAEVFTPAWLCNQMNNYCDEDWFGRSGVFNTENKDGTWRVNPDKIEFPKGKNWRSYVDSRRLEITCGEAPFLVSRYDVSTGEPIEPIARRVGILDRKLRVVAENTENYDEWLKWAVRAVEACYGYEYQGDNVLIARVNLLMTFLEYHDVYWETKLQKSALKKIANRIAWNIWQMDGLKDTAPLGKPYVENAQLSIFDDENAQKEASPPCLVYNWRSGGALSFADLKRQD